MRNASDSAGRIEDFGASDKHVIHYGSSACEVTSGFAGRYERILALEPVYRSSGAGSGGRISKSAKRATAWLHVSSLSTMRPMPIGGR